MNSNKNKNIENERFETKKVNCSTKVVQEQANIKINLNAANGNSKQPVQNNEAKPQLSEYQQTENFLECMKETVKPKLL